MSEQELEVTGTPQTDATAEVENQGTETKTFTQEDVDRILKDRLDRERKRFEKKFEGVDIDRYRQLAEKEENERIEQQKQRGEFEEILKSTVQKKDSTISDLQRQLTEIKVDGNLLNAASSARAINPQQVVSLLKNQVRLGETGEAEIVDNNNNVRYTDQGTAMTVNDLVKEFIDANPHFISAGPQGSGPISNTGDGVKKGIGNVDTSQLNMNNPEDRKIYKEIMKTRGIRI
jgi:hypothetical protein